MHEGVSPTPSRHLYMSVDRVGHVCANMVPKACRVPLSWATWCQGASGSSPLRATRPRTPRPGRRQRGSESRHIIGVCGITPMDNFVHPSVGLATLPHGLPTSSIKTETLHHSGLPVPLSAWWSTIALCAYEAMPTSAGGLSLRAVDSCACILRATTTSSCLFLPCSASA